jgi:hypothetical protein
MEGIEQRLAQWAQIPQINGEDLQVCKAHCLSSAALLVATARWKALCMPAFGVYAAAIKWLL